jgi:hypothetical protein
MVKSGKGEMQFGGVIYSDSADKTTDLLPIVIKEKFLWFSTRCNRFYGRFKIRTWRNHKRWCQNGKCCGKFCCSKFTIITGNSFGAGNYAMCGKLMTLD